jgi:hypothetical protein
MEVVLPSAAVKPRRWGVLSTHTERVIMTREILPQSTKITNIFAFMQNCSGPRTGGAA